MNAKDFFLKLKQRCMQEHRKKGCCNCAQCSYQTFCYTPPFELSENLIEQVQKSLEETDKFFETDKFEELEKAIQQVREFLEKHYDIECKVIVTSSYVEVVSTEMYTPLTDDERKE